MTGPDPAHRADPADPGDHESLRAERDHWRARCLEAEQVAEDLAGQLAAARQAAADAEAERAAPPLVGGPGDPEAPASDATDPALAVFATAAMAVVAVMAAVLVIVNGALLSLGGILTVLIAGGLVWLTNKLWELRLERLRRGD